MTHTGSILIIQDRTELVKGVGSKLFGGEKLYAYCDNISMSGKNNVTAKPRIGIDLKVESDDDLNAHWNRRKGESQFSSTETNIITTKGRWITSLGSVNILGSVLTPYKIMRLGISGHQFYLKGTRLLDNILAGENETVGSIYDAGSGVPVTIETWSTDARSSVANEVTWNMTFQEDRE